MSQTLTGTAAGITPRQSVTATAPSDGDADSASSVNTPFQTVLNLLTFLMNQSVLQDASSTVNAALDLEGVSGDANACISTTTAPTARKLLWQASCGGSPTMYVRLYAVYYNGSGPGFEITLNAQWNGTQWALDSTSPFPAKLALSPDSSNNLRLYRYNSTSSFSDTAWSVSFLLDPAGNFSGGSVTLSQQGQITAAGTITQDVAGIEGAASGAGADVGGWTAFPKLYPSTPSTHTFSSAQASNITNGTASTGYTLDYIDAGGASYTALASTAGFASFLARFAFT